MQDAVGLIRGGLKDTHKVAASAGGGYHEVRADIKKGNAEGSLKPIDTKTMAEKEADPTDAVGQA